MRSGYCPIASTSSSPAPWHLEQRGLYQTTTPKPGDRDRAYLEVDGATRRGPVHVIHDLLDRVDDETIATAIRLVWDLQQRWMAVPLGGKLSLSWPLRPEAG
jgi:hypothetical protein